MNAYPIQAQIYKVLMHPTRLAILDVLRGGEQCVCHMEAALGLRQAHISQHLMVLRDAGLVTDRREGWNIFYRVSKPEIYSVIDAVNAFTGVADHAPSSRVQTQARKKTCPCPKCNPASGLIQPDRPDLALGEAPAAG